MYHDTTKYPVVMDGNVFLKGAQPSKHEMSPLEIPDYDPKIKLSIENDEVYLELTIDPDWKNQRHRKLVMTELLGRAKTSELPYVDADGKQICINLDYLGQVRDEDNPYPGPFEITGDGRLVLKVWPFY